MHSSQLKDSRKGNVHYFSLSASTPRDDSYMEVKQNLETARQQLGPDWLQYLVHNKASPHHKREELAHQAVLANGIKPEATDDDIFLNAEEPVINSEGKDLKVFRINYFH